MNRLPAPNGRVLGVWGEPTACHIAALTTAFRPGDTAVGTITQHVGGSALATAIGAAHLGTTVVFHGPFGTDADGRWVLSHATQRGVHVHCIDVEQSRRSHIVVEPDGQRSMVTDLGSAFVAPHADGSNLATTSDLGVVHVSLTSIVRDRTDAVLRLVQRCARTTPISIDLGGVSVVAALGLSRWEALLSDVTPRFVFGNAAEWAALYGSAGATRYEHTGGTGGGWWFEKRGAEPCVVQHADSTVVVEATAGPCVDTTGAGDAFAAAALAAYLAGETDPAVLARAGHRYAAHAIATVGTVVPHDARL